MAATNKFINRDLTLTDLPRADNGLADYKGQDRKSFLKEDGRKSAEYPFSRWDRIIQANKICEIDLQNKDLTTIPSLQKAYRNFTK